MAKASSGQNTVQLVEELVRPVIEGLGFQLWDVRFEKEGPDWFLRVFVDRQGERMDLDACEQVSRAIDPVIDKADPIKESYFMEVGSPGLGRKLTRPEHFTPYMGQKVAVRLIRPDEEGQRDYEGQLAAFENGAFTLQIENDKKTFLLTAASFVKLCDDEDLF